MIRRAKGIPPRNFSKPPEPATKIDIERFRSVLPPSVFRLDSDGKIGLAELAGLSLDCVHKTLHDPNRKYIRSTDADRLLTALEYQWLMDELLEDKAA